MGEPVRAVLFQYIYNESSQNFSTNQLVEIFPLFSNFCNLLVPSNSNYFSFFLQFLRNIKRCKKDVFFKKRTFFTKKDVFLLL